MKIMIKASPIARKLSEEAGIDLKELKGSGPAQRIIKRDIERWILLRDREAPAKRTDYC